MKDYICIMGVMNLIIAAIVAIVYAVVGAVEYVGLTFAIMNIAAIIKIRAMHKASRESSKMNG